MYTFDTLIAGSRVGIKESYKQVGDRVELLIGVMLDGKIPRLVTFYQTSGFVNLRDMMESEEDMEKFLRGNRPTYGVFGYVAMLCKLVKVGETVESVEFFVPVAEEDGGRVVCDLVSTSSGYRRRVIGEHVYNAILNNFLEDLKKLSLDSKEDYLRSRL